MNTRVQIRPAVPDEIPFLTRLIEQSLAALGAQDYSPQQLKSAIEHVVGVDSRMVDDGTYYVAVVEGTLAGCGGWSRRPGVIGSDKLTASSILVGTEEFLDPASDAAKIRAMYVHPHFARQGIGKQLLQKCEGEARQNQFVELELLATRTGEKLYRKAGYAPREQFEMELPDGVLFPVTRMTKPVAALSA